VAFYLYINWELVPLFIVKFSTRILSVRGGVGGGGASGQLRELYEGAKSEKRYAEAAQILIQIQKNDEEAGILSLKEQVEMFLTIITIIVSVATFYPYWCRLRHAKFPYSSKQLELRRDILLIDFLPTHKPLNPRFGLRLIQSFAIFEIFKRFMMLKRQNNSK
jgi:hypothetical protein